MWLHEIKQDGFRVIARNEGKRVLTPNLPPRAPAALLGAAAAVLALAVGTPGQ